VTDPATPDTEPLRFYRSFTVGADFPSKLAAASFRYLLVNPAGLVRVIAIAVAFAAAVFITTVQTNGPGYALTLGVAGLFGFLVLIAIVTAIGLLVERRRLRSQIPGGSEFAVGFREKTILMRSPRDTAEVAFDKYQSFETSGDFVVLRQRSTRILNFLPAECFTPESLTYLREKIPLPPRAKPRGS
jgi:uncharacterized membrane protein YbhN (UPF0104 family)